VAHGLTPSFTEAWGGALAYTLQLYFDFSGYSDMAIGLGRMFGIRIPVNFNSPYQSLSIIEFWRRWHMTLSRFLRDYLYIPLGGNRQGNPRQYLNLMLTMLLGGIWHGAGWTFLVWGGLHGLYLVINNLWRQLRSKLGFQPGSAGWLGRQASWAITFLCVTAAWVIFRSNNFATAAAILKAMFGFNGLLPPESVYYTGLVDKVLSRVIFGLEGWARIVIYMGMVKFLPNTQQLMRRFEPVLGEPIEEPGRFWAWLRWNPSLVWAALIALFMLLAVLSISRTSEFIYFQF
jgi:D-alanyl-lipoteichoic acid acyltransferase DltB (MBOAT superfamily)